MFSNRVPILLHSQRLHTLSHSQSVPTLPHYQSLHVPKLVSPTHLEAGQQRHGLEGGSRQLPEGVVHANLAKERVGAQGWNQWSTCMK